MLITNCKNCGAILNYEKVMNGIIKCEYCGTNYSKYDIDPATVKNTTDEIIEIKILGKTRKYYIGDMEFCNLYNDCFRDEKGTLKRHPIKQLTKLKLIEL